MMLARHFSAKAVAVAVLAALFGSFAASLSLADGGWVDVRVVGPFVIRADFPLAGHDALLTDLGQLQADLSRTLGVRPASETIELYLFRDERTYRAHLAHYYPGMPYLRAVFIKEDGPGRVFVPRGSTFAIDVRHECTHALLHASLPVVPLWLDEGLAKYFEMPADRRASGNPYLGGTRVAARFGMLSGVEKLEQIGNATKMGRYDYRDSWAWVHFMLHGPAEARHELIAFLADLQASNPPGTLSHRLARRLDNPHSQMARHFRTWK